MREKNSARRIAREEERERRARERTMPYESAPPFIIIVGAFCAMAGIQYLGNDVIYGKPKVRTTKETKGRGCKTILLIHTV